MIRAINKRFVVVQNNLHRIKSGIYKDKLKNKIHNNTSSVDRRDHSFLGRRRRQLFKEVVSELIHVYGYNEYWTKKSARNIWRTTVDISINDNVDYFSFLVRYEYVRILPEYREFI